MTKIDALRRELAGRVFVTETDERETVCNVYRERINDEIKRKPSRYPPRPTLDGFRPVRTRIGARYVTTVYHRGVTKPPALITFHHLITKRGAF